MANTFITVEEIAERSLPFLEANLTQAGVVNRDFDNDFKGRGDTVQVRKPQIFDATEFVPATGVTFGDVTEEKVDVKLDTILTVDKKIESNEMALNINDFEMQYIMPAMKGLAQKVDTKLMALYSDIPYSVGVAGTTPDAIEDVTNSRKMLNNNKAPLEQRYLILDPDAEGELLQLDAFANMSASQDPNVLNEGFLGRKYGFDIAMNQNIPSHVKGTMAGTPLTDTATLGDISITINGATADTTLTKGDLITIAGNQYVVTADVVFTLGTSSVGIYPALIASSNDEAVTVVANSVNNLAFNRDAFCFVNRPLAIGGGNVQSATVNVNGLAVRVTYGYNQQYKENTLSWDILTGFKTLYPELAVRLLG